MILCRGPSAFNIIAQQDGLGQAVWEEAVTIGILLHKS
jgi:hypothetical protein